jgi:hypothetical protein
MKLGKPFSDKLVIRILAGLLVVISLLTGYYHTLYTNQLKLYKRLEDKYVRVREILGVGQTQDLIDLSHELEAAEEMNGESK